MKNRLQNSRFLASFLKYFPDMDDTPPWELISRLQEILLSRWSALQNDYLINGNIAIHKSATVEQHVIIKGVTIIGPGAFVGAHAYLRGGVFVGEGSSIGPGCEVKNTVILDRSALAHFSFAGDSVIGSNVNMEAGSILANYHNDREVKTIHMIVDGEQLTLPVAKFGSLICDGVRIGANAVCGPGTFLPPDSVVKRLQLIEQT